MTAVVLAVHMVGVQVLGGMDLEEEVWEGRLVGLWVDSLEGEGEFEVTS
jgi:hypothetical protein